MVAPLTRITMLAQKHSLNPKTTTRNPLPEAQRLHTDGANQFLGKANGMSLDIRGVDS